MLNEDAVAPPPSGYSVPVSIDDSSAQLLPT